MLKLGIPDMIPEKRFIGYRPFKRQYVCKIICNKEV